MQSSRVAVVAVAVLCAACGSSGRVRPSDGSGAPVDASGEVEAGVPGSDGAASGDAGSSSGSGAACSLATMGACNSVALQGPLVTPTVSSAAGPLLSAGAIADGTYVLTAVTTYAVTAPEADGSALSPGLPMRATLVVAGDCMQWNDSMGGSQNVSYSTDATGQLTLDRECPAPAGGSGWASYAVSAATLLLAPLSSVGTNTVYTFARQ